MTLDPVEESRHYQEALEARRRLYSETQGSLVMQAERNAADEYVDQALHFTDLALMATEVAANEQRESEDRSGDLVVPSGNPNRKPLRSWVALNDEG